MPQILPRLTIQTFVFTVASSAWISPQLVNYSLSVIEYLANQHTGFFQCVFYDIGGGRPFDNWFDELLQSPRLSKTPRLIINSSYWIHRSWYLTYSPSLMVINLRKPDYSVDPKEILWMFQVLDPNTRIIVLFAGAQLSFMKELASILARPNLFTRVVFIEIRILKIVRTGFDGHIEDFTDFVHPRELFRNILRDMRGRLISFSSESTISTVGRNWMEGTAEFLNATVRYYKSPCDDIGLANFNDCYKEHLLEKRIIISVTSMGLATSDEYLQRMLFDVLPRASLVAVPDGKNLLAKDMFFWSLNWTVWMILVSILMAVQLINRSWSKFSRVRKLVVLSIILFLAFVVHLCGTRLMSFMIVKPMMAGKIGSAEDLVDSKMILKVFKSFDSSTTTVDNIFKNASTVYINDDILLMDGASAYYGPSDRIEIIVRTSRYRKLSDFYGMRVGTYAVLRSDQLTDMFYFTQRVFFEAGFLFKWKCDDIGRMIGDESEEVEGLRIADLLVVWIGLVLGLLTSCIAFGQEIAVRGIKNH